MLRASPEKLVGSAPRGRARTARGQRRGSKSKSDRAMLSTGARKGSQAVVTRSFSARLRSALGRGGTRESVAFRSRISARSVGRRIALFYPRAVKIYLTRLKIQHWIWRGVSGRAHTAGGLVCNLGSGPWRSSHDRGDLSGHTGVNAGGKGLIYPYRESVQNRPY